MLLPFFTGTFIATPSPEKKIAYKTFFVLKECLATIGRLLCLVAQILLLTFLTGSKKWTQVSSPVTTLANCFLSYFGNIWSSFLATLTRCLFCSSVNRCGTHLAEIFLTFKCFFKIRWTVENDMPTFCAISRTVNLASPSMISFILETISLRDADFGLPDFGAFLMESTPDSNFFFHRRTVS